MDLVCIDVFSSRHYLELDDRDSNTIVKAMRPDKLVDDFPCAATE